MKAILAGLFSLFLLPVPAYAQTAQSATATPAVDIVIEANTLAPAFYQGRHEPTPGSELRAVAIVNGSSPAAYTYRWEVGGVTRTSDNTISFDTPLGSPFLVRVDVFDAAGARLATAQRYISLSEPEVVFYTNNLLRSMSRTAIGGEHILTGDEVEIRAEPYFVNANIFSGNYNLTWSVGGTEVASAAGDEQTLTLRRQEGTGSALVEFSLHNLNALQQQLKGGFSIQF